MSKFLRCGVLATLGISLGASLTVSAQQTVPFARGVPVAPTGLQDQPLGEGPWTYRTAEDMDIKVTVFAKIEYPYSMAFLPSGELLVTTRKGELRLIDKNGKSQLVTGGPPSVFRGKSGSLGAVHGYMSLVVHPQFAQNRLIYFFAHKPEGESAYAAVLVKARLNGLRLENVTELLAGEGIRGATALTMTSDGMLWVGTGGDAAAQDPKVLNGKVLRLTDDGKPAPGNPFVGKEGYRPEIYSMGHRAALALTAHPQTNEIFLSEMGPNGGDEINWIQPGKNYGWPVVSLGRTYAGPWQNEANVPTHQGYEPPVVYWTPAIANAGLTFYTGQGLPKWKGDLFVAGMRYGEVPGTGRLDRVLLNDKMEELRRESLLVDLHQRIRDVKQGPDGYLYVATDEEQGVILRLTPR